MNGLSNLPESPAAAVVVTPSEPAEIVDLDTVLIDLERLDPHPDNRPLDPDAPAIVEMAESLKERGQLEALRVRQVSREGEPPHYQVISGHRRRLAMLWLQWKQARCELVNCPDEVALAELAEINARRQDLSPLERAKLLRRLTQSASRGGGGLSAEDAGKLFGLQTAKAVQSIMRLQRLPKPLQNLLESGDLSERNARNLLPFVTADAPLLKKAIIDNLTSELLSADATADMIEAGKERTIPRFVAAAIEEHCRPMHRLERSRDGEFCSFTPEGKQGKQLRIVKLPFVPTDGSKRSDQQYATNVRLWESLNAKALETVCGDCRKERLQCDCETRSEIPEVKPKPVRRSRKEQLAAKTSAWRSRLIRCFLAHEDVTMPTIYSAMPWLLSRVQWRDGSTLSDLTIVAAAESGVSVHRGNRVSAAGVVRNLLESVDGPDGVWARLWQLVLWPSAEAKEPTPGIQTKAVVSWNSEMPDDFDLVAGETLVQLLSLCEFQLSDCWAATAVEGTPEAELLKQWLELLSIEDIVKLYRQKPAMKPLSTRTKPELIEQFLEAHFATDASANIRPMPQLLKTAK